MLEEIETPPDSVFHDRREGYFTKWLLDQGLAPDAPDAVILPHMEEYVRATGKSTIQTDVDVPKSHHIPGADIAQS